MRLISNNIKLLEAPQFKYPYCHCLLIEDDLTCLVDSSPFESEKDYLKRKHIDLIINTHGHQDHCLINPDYPSATVYMHKNDHHLVESGELYLQEFGFDIFSNNQIRPFFLSAIGYRTRPADESIENGTIINLGKNIIETIFIPGHCAGHCGFILPRQGLIFTGDIDLGTFPWYGNVQSSIKDFLSSIQLLIEMKPDGIITGHGAGLVTKNLTIKLEKYRDTILFRELEIIKLLAQGNNTIEDIAAYYPVYKKLPQPELVFYLYECMMVLKHLEHLIELDKVIFESGKYYLKEGVRAHNINII